MNEEEKPPLPSSPPPEPYEPPRGVSFALSTESPLYDYNLVTSYSSSTSSPSALYVTNEYQRYSPSSPGIPLIPEEQKPTTFSFIESLFLPVSSSNSSWQYPPSTTPTPPMIIEEGIVKNGSTHPVSPRSIANSLDSLSECAQHHQSDVQNANTNGDRSRSLGDLLSATTQDGNDSMRNGSYDTLVSKGGNGLTDSGIGAGLLMMRDEMDIMDDNNTSPSSPDRIPTDISSPDSFSYPAVSFASYDPVGAGNIALSYSNENTNPLDSSSRGHSSDDRKHSELPAISEESEHEQSIHIPYNYQLNHQNPHASSVGPLPSAIDRHREVVEHTYPMFHCKSAPSTNSFINNNIEHRRVVSDDVTEITRLKRSEEMENMDKIGRNSFEKRSASSQNLKKGRCKSAMVVFQGELDEQEDSEDEDNDVDGYSKDNEMLILDKGGADERYRYAGASKANQSLRHYDNHANLPSISSSEPPPVRIHRKVSAASAASSSRSSPYKASDQSWKDKMPPFGMVGHTMYSPQSLPTRDAVPRSPFDGSGTISGASGVISGGSQRLISVELPTGGETETDGTTTSPDSTSPLYTTPIRPRLLQYHNLPSPPALLATSEVTEDIMPLSEICNNNRFSISSSINTDHSSPASKSQTSNPNNSFVRRSLRKIMKRGSVSTTTLGTEDGGLRTGSLKRRASNASSSFFASAQAHLRPRPKSLKKQRIGKNKKEKSGSDTFTFGNLFRKKPTASRPNLADIISDLDQRSTTSRQMSGGGSLSVGATNRRSTSATILPMSGGPNDPTTPFDSASLDGRLK
ncbi:hypothetical protein CRE_14241 [Caenorhabditis remanei]|uniref:Uncharacterized protein n=1 Tax=Caenorhabditis remanei TaxID=31234 RepID=E3N1N9_CAERE|nr:hypothetical protein CRE_14241 [Caenorhabditis remanei]